MSLPLPRPVASLLLGGAWRLCGWGGEPGWLDGIASSLTLDCSRAERELGWKPRFSAWEAIASAVETN